MSWRNGSSGFRIRVKAKSAPVAAGFQSFMMMPFGTYTTARGRLRAVLAGAASAGNMASSSGKGNGGAHASAAACGGRGACR